MIQLTLTLKMTTAQVVKTSVTVNNNSPIQDYVHPDDQTQPTFYSFISLSLFNKNNTWRPTCFIIQTTGFNRPAKFLILLKHWGYDNFELNWFHGLSKSLAIDSLFPGERRLISLQHSEILSISLCFHCLSPDMFCTACSHAEPPRNIHARNARGNFIPILKITPDELPMEQGVYGGCLLCPLHPLLVQIQYLWLVT